VAPVGRPVLRDRAGSFAPVLIPKRSGRISGLDTRSAAYHLGRTAGLYEGGCPADR
jgi:hypothetical protein